MTQIATERCLLGSNRAEVQIGRRCMTRQIRFRIVEGLKSCSDT